MDKELQRIVIAEIVADLIADRNALREALIEMLDLWQKCGGNDEDWAVVKAESALNPTPTRAKAEEASVIRESRTTADETEVRAGECSYCVSERSYDICDPLNE